MWGDPAVARFIGGKPFTREEVWARILRYVGHWTLMGFGFWAIEEKATGDFIGEVGLADFQRDLDPPWATDRKPAGPCGRHRTARAMARRRCAPHSPGGMSILMARRSIA